MFEKLGQQILAGARALLPDEWEYKLGITQKSEPMVFDIGENLTEYGKQNALSYIKGTTAPGTYAKIPFVQKEILTKGDGIIPSTLKKIIEFPEKLITSAFKAPSVIKSGGVVGERGKKIYEVPYYWEDYLVLEESFIKADVPFPKLAAGLLTGGSAVIDASIMGNLIDKAATQILTKQPFTPAQITAARQSMGLKKNWTIAEREKSFRTLSHITHPDKATGSHQAFTRLNKANEVLSVAEKTTAISRGAGQVAATLKTPVSQLGKPGGTPYIGVRELLPEIAGTRSTQPYQGYSYKSAGLSIRMAPSKPIDQTSVRKDLTPNLKNIKASGDVRKVIENVAKDYVGTIDKARRGVITQTQTQELADALNITPAKLTERGTGGALNAEQLTAARDLLVTSANNVANLAKNVKLTGSEKDLYDFRIELNKHIAIQSEVAGATAEAGRALSAMNIKAEPKEPIAEFYKRINEVMGGRELTEEMARRVAQIDPNDFVAMNKFLSSITRAKTTDKIFEYWVNSILSNPLTHQVNNISNSLVRLTTIPIRAVSTGLDLLNVAITGKAQERFFGEIAADVVGMTKGVFEGTRRALDVILRGAQPGTITKLEMSQMEAIKTPYLGGAIRTPGKFLIAEDEFFKALNSQAELYAQAYRKAAMEGAKGTDRARRMAEIINDPSPEMISSIRAEELYKTFQKELGKPGKALTKFRNSVPGLRYIIPFLRTPINIAKFGLEMTPLNFLRLGYQKAKGMYPGVEFTDELAKPVVGSMISAGMLYLYSIGKLTGHAPVDKEERDAFYREGNLPYSIKVADTWYSYQRLEPIGTIVGMTADFAQDYELLSEEANTKAIKSITASVTQNLVNKTYLQGISNMVNAISDPIRYGGNWMEMFISGFVPQVALTPTTIMDPYYRRADGVIDALKKKLPGLSEDVTAVRNVWGEAVRQEGSALYRTTVPIKKSLAKNDSVDIALKELNYEMGFPSTTIQNFKLDPQHYDIYLRATGRRIKEILNQVVQQEDYQFKTDENKRKIINKVVHSTRERFREEFGFVLFMEQMDIAIPATITDETAIGVYNALKQEHKFKIASNLNKRKIYIRNLDKFISY